MKIDTIRNSAFKSFDLQREEIEQKAKDITKQNKRNEKMVLAASVAGAFIPLALYNAKKGKMGLIKDVFTSSNSKLKDKASAVSGLLEVENIKQIGVSVTGSILGGLGAGLLSSKTPEDKKAKCKEGVYGFLNCMIPMSIITATEAFMRKKNIKTGLLGKAGILAAGIGGGMLLTNKVANGLNKAVFKEDSATFKKRDMELTDCLVHFDDLLGVMVLSKVPFADKLGKALPFIYSHVGYETGTQT